MIKLVEETLCVLDSKPLAVGVRLLLPPTHYSQTSLATTTIINDLGSSGRRSEVVY